MEKYIVVSRLTLEQKTLNTAHDAALWMVGKDIRNYFVLKQTLKLIEIAHGNMDTMQKQFQEA